MPKSVAEILGSADRGATGLALSARSDLEKLRDEWQGIGLAGLPFIDFIPIRIVSLIERQVRHCLSEIINFGEPYASRAIEFLGKDFSSKNILDAFAATTSKKITLGRLVSFSFSVGNLNALIATLEAIFGKDIKQRLSAIITLWSDGDAKDRVPLISSLDATLGTMDRLFRLRHLLVHEAVTYRGVLYEDIDDFFVHAKEFMEALTWLLVEQTRGPISRTQIAMNLRSYEDAVAATHELDLLRGGASDSFKEPATQAQRLEYHWDEFCRLSAEKASGYDVDEYLGSMATLIYVSEIERLTRWRIEQFQVKTELDVEF